VMMDGWSIGLSPSKAKRSRCVNAFYPGVRSFETNFAEARALYKRVGLPCIFRVTPFVADATIDATLATLGCEKFDETCVQTLSINAHSNRAISSEIFTFDSAIELSQSPDIIGRSIQELRGDSDEEIAALMARWQSLPLTLRSYATHDFDAKRPTAQVVTLREGDTLGVFDVVTAPAYRGRGLASRLLARALSDARDAGVTSAYLQVVSTNPAKRVYERLGFRTAYTYWYREVPDDL
jgi:GNAT superfamily N-acetyltransferase